MSTLGSPRRYYLAKRHVARDLEDKGLELMWQAKQEVEPGTALPSDFPELSTLASLGYTTTEDLTGADEEELVDLGISPRTAQNILASFAEL